MGTGIGEALGGIAATMGWTVAGGVLGGVAARAVIQRPPAVTSDKDLTDRDQALMEVFAHAASASPSTASWAPSWSCGPWPGPQSTSTG